MRKLPVALALSALTLSLVGAGASADATGEMLDIAGDANLVNNQGQTTVAIVAGNPVGVPHVDGQDTGQASYAPADLRKVTLETTYQVVPVGEDGLFHQATGIQIRTATTATPKSDGPTLIYRLTTNIGGCNSFLQTFVRGPAAGPNDTADKTVQWRQLTASACPDAATTQTNAGWTQTISDKEIVMTFPYSAMSSKQFAALAPGKVLSAPQFGVRTLLAALTAPQIDETRVGADFVIGSDLPADVPCTVGCPE